MCVSEGTVGEVASGRTAGVGNRVAPAAGRGPPAKRLIGVACALLLAVGLAACGSDDSATTSAPAAPTGAGPKASSGGQAASSGDVATGASVPEGEPVGVERSVIYTADLTVRVDSVSGATDEATNIVTTAGGYLFSQQSDLRGEEQSVLTFKVPPDRFTEVLDALDALGTTTKRNVSAADVTAEVVDLEGRLATARASADRLRVLLGTATSTDDILEIESELAKRESEIESLEGQLRVIESQVDLATVDLLLTEHAEVAVSDDLPAVVDALRAGWVALLTAGQVLAVVLAFSLPFLPFALVGWWGIRRYRRRHPPKPPPPEPTLPAGWAPDPSGGHQYRYWTGLRWTEHVSDHGVVVTDPMRDLPPDAGDDDTEAGDAENLATSDQSGDTGTA
jgi:hypothetical protein